MIQYLIIKLICGKPIHFYMINYFKIKMGTIVIYESYICILLLAFGATMITAI